MMTCAASKSATRAAGSPILVIAPAPPVDTVQLLGDAIACRENGRDGVGQDRMPLDELANHRAPAPAKCARRSQTKAAQQPANAVVEILQPSHQAVPRGEQD